MEVNAKVGDTVYIRLDGNAARCIRTDEELIQEWKVTRIGRKYIYAKRQGDVRDTCFEFFEGYRNMHPGRWVEKSEMVPDYLLYFSKQEIEEEIQKESLGSKIQIYAKYDVFKLSLDQMRKIDQVFKVALEGAVDSDAWIPVSSGNYPEDATDVQVTYLGYNDKKPYCDEHAYRKDGVWYWTSSDESIAVEITAWKPMCEPYR